MSRLVIALALLASSLLTSVTASNAAPTRTVSAVEYYNSQLDHYFVTATPEEIAALDNGRYPGWAPTSQSFPVLPLGTTDRGTTPVCRFYGTSSAGINSHFYSANPAECSEVQHKYPGTWVLESSSVFRAYLPDLTSGVCPAGTKPIHRLWNKRADSNHRYTDNLAIVAAMERQGYVADGYGPQPGTAFCVPAVARVAAQANGMTCTVVASETSPLAGSRITLVANCSGNPTSYTWEGCSSTTNTCIAMSGVGGSNGYSVVATDGASNTGSASTSVNWRTVFAPHVSCSLTTSNSAPVVGSSITVTAVCGGHQVAYAWTGCAQLPSGNACIATSATTGTKTYSVTASINGANSVTTTTVNWQSALPPPVSCTVASSNATPIVGTNVTLTATCTGSPTNFTWVGCSSSTTSCVTTSATVGSSSYAVTASSATSTGSPAIVGVNWQAAPPGAVSCTLSASNPTPAVGASVTLTSACTGNPTTFNWVGCISSTSSCVASSSIVGNRSYSMTAGNSSGAGAPATISVNWQTASPPPPPPPTGEVGSWTRYATGPGSVNEATEQTWYNLAWDTRRNRAYGVSWLKTLSAFDPAVGTWTVVSPSTGRSDFHNRTIAYDPVNDRLWVSDGTGNTGTGGAFQYFDFSTSSWVPAPMGSAPSYESTMIFDPANKRLIAFGGWLLGSVTTFALQPVAAAWRYETVPGIAPTFATDVQKMTAWRSVLDSSRNRILYVDTDGSIWALPLSLSGWQHIGTTGVPPPATTQFVYDVANDAIVGWSAAPSLVVEDGITGTTRSTWLLPLSTLAWSQAANIGHGEVVPVATPYVGYAMVYDPVRSQTLLHTIAGGDEFSPQTWFYRAPAGGTPPPPPGVSCNLATSNATPAVGSSVTLTATCSGGPTAYAWVGCTSSSATCVATSSTAGSKTYSVTASNSNSASSPATVSVNWQAGSTPVACGVTASNTTPVTGTNITLTAACSGSPTSFVWVGCTSSTSICIATSASAGARTYSMTASNASSTSSPAAATVNWLAAPPPPPTITGTWVAGVLPNMPNTGAAVAPFMNNQETKHVAMVEVAPGKIAVYGGDYTGAPYPDSYRQDSWTLDVATGIWTQRGAYGSPDPRPRRPDTMGIGWDAVNQRVLFVPGVITEGVGEVWSHYADGHWVKETTNFGGTGMLRGGVYDAQTRRWLAFAQSASLGSVVREWNVDTWQSVATTPWPGSTGQFTEYVEDSLPTIVGRNVYLVAREIRADSTTSVRLFRWNIDTRTMTRMADPPVPVNTPESTLLGTSGNKVVWPYILGPEGVIVKVLVYDTTTNVWSEDVGRPSLASQYEFLGNSVCSLSDGSVFMAGSAFNSTRQTHWFRRLQ